MIETTDNDIKERLSVGVVTLIAARAGCEVSSGQVDRLSMDVTIRPIAGKKVNIDVQLKATSNLVFDGAFVKYDLSVKNYDDLRALDVGAAQLLVVVDLHEENGNWLSGNEDELQFRRCAYWCSLHGQPPTTNTTKIRVSIPRDQVFTPASLISLIESRYAKIAANDGSI